MPKKKCGWCRRMIDTYKGKLLPHGPCPKGGEIEPPKPKKDMTKEIEQEISKLVQEDCRKN